MATFKHYYKYSTPIGSGTYQFIHYSTTPETTDIEVNAPSIYSDGTHGQVSWDHTNTNATYYDLRLSVQNSNSGDTVECAFAKYYPDYEYGGHVARISNTLGDIITLQPVAGFDPNNDTVAPGDFPSGFEVGEGEISIPIDSIVEVWLQDGQELFPVDHVSAVENSKRSGDVSLTNLDTYLVHSKTATPDAGVSDIII